MQKSFGALNINLSAIRHNWRLLKSNFTGPDCAAVVKANAYGLGVAAIVHSLFSEGCRTFFVANIEEALAVKKILPDSIRIFVLQGCPPGEEEAFVQHRLSPVLISKSMLRRWIAVCGRDSEATFAIKVNTGMNRLGLSMDEYLSWLRAGTQSHLAPAMLMSHLACADETGHPMNQMQLDRFSALVAESQAVFPGMQFSLANSAAVFLGEAWHFDVARPGIALYGGCEGVSVGVRLRPVVSLTLPVVQVRSVRAGEWVGYGATYTAEKDLTLAILSGGYADGLIRSLSNVAQGFYRGYQVPLVGRISMDTCAFDVSDVPVNLMPEEGDHIQVLGGECGVTDQASRAGTISYELLTRLGERFIKRYIEE